MLHRKKSELIDTPNLAPIRIAENKHLRANVFPLHYHNVNELLYIIDGKGKIILEGSQVPLRKSDLILIRPYEEHIVIDEPTDLLHLYCIHFSDEVLNDQQDGCRLTQFIKELDLRRRIISTVDNPEFYRIPQYFEEILFEQDNRTEESNLLVKFIFAEVLIKIKRFLYQGISRTASSMNSLSSTERSVLSVIHYVEKNYYRNLLIEDLAKMVPLGVRQFTRIFKKLTKKNIKEFTQELRINEAKRLLSTQQKEIKEISSEVGFEDLSHFYRVFRKFTGTTPKNYLTGSRAVYLATCKDPTAEQQNDFQLSSHTTGRNGDGPMSSGSVPGR